MISILAIENSNHIPSDTQPEPSSLKEIFTVQLLAAGHKYHMKSAPCLREKGCFYVGLRVGFVLGLSYAPTSQDRMHRSDSIPMVSIRPGYLTFYSESTKSGSKLSTKSAAGELPDRNTADGLISDKAARRLSQSIDWMIYLALPKRIYPDRPHCKLHFRVNFLTLTLSSRQVHEDNTIKEKLLQPFLDTLRKTWGCKLYMWRAEPQKNGNIHFHLVTDVYIPWWKIRNRWNDIQNTLGYVDRWKGKTKSGIPNSTDVHSVKKVRNLGAYLAKYMGKGAGGAMYTALQAVNDGLMPCYNPSEALKIYPAAAGKFRSIGGNLWGLSYTLSKVKSVVLYVNDIRDNSLHQFWQLFGKQAKEYDYHTCLYVPVAEWARQVKGELYSFFVQYLEEYRNLQPVPI